MANDIPLYYWDAAIFYEWLNEEPVDLAKSQAIQKLLAENKAKLNRICTSVVCHAEVIPAKLAPDKADVYRNLFNSVHFFDIEISRNTITLSQRIKDYYYKPRSEDNPSGRIMGTGDAIHLAAAIIEGVTEFHTRDNKRRGGNVPLLSLLKNSPGGKVCGEFELAIVSPLVEQTSLDFSASKGSAASGKPEHEPEASEAKK